jgi:FKBP-type peptidyl-prolyl cis-trans isomerase FklB
MKLQWILGGALALSVVSCGGENKEGEDLKETSELVFTNESDSLSYAVGIAQSQFFPIKDLTGVDKVVLEKGYNDYLSGAHSVSGNESNLYVSKFLEKYSTDQSKVSKAVYDSLSYALGVYFSEGFKRQGVPDIKGKFLAEGFADEMAKVAKLDSLEIERVFNRSIKKQEALQAKKMEEQQKNFATKIESEKEFFVENAKRPEIVTLPSGLQYEIIKNGKGRVPVIANVVKAHYTGMFLDGKVFESTDGKDPVDFPVGQVIKGWTEALQLMPVGSKWKLYIPYNLAYGERGNPSIEPYSALIFDVELVDIVQ